MRAIANWGILSLLAMLDDTNDIADNTPVINTANSMTQRGHSRKKGDICAISSSLDKTKTLIGLASAKTNESKKTPKPECKK